MTDDEVKQMSPHTLRTEIHYSKVTVVLYSLLLYVMYWVSTTLN